MKIFYFVNHTANFDGNSGIQRVTRYLGQALGEVGHDVVFVTWLDKKRAATRACDDELRRLARWNGPLFRPQGARGHPLEQESDDRDGLAGGWLIVPELPYHRGSEGDMTLALIDYAHRVGLKIAFVFHDLIPVTMPGYEYYRLRHTRYAQQMVLADMIIAVSRHAAGALERYYLERLRLPQAELPQIVPCPLPEEVPGWERDAAAREPPSGGIGVLSLGSIEPRKNQYRLLRAFNALCEKQPTLDMQLTLVGNHYPLALRRIVGLLRRNPRVAFVGPLPDDAVRALYDKCHFTVFPSIEEGFGLPIVESLWIGRPCLCANFGAMAEAAAGGGCLTVDTRSVAELERGIERLARDGDLRLRLARAAAERHMRSWCDHAREVVRALDRHSGIRQAVYWVDFTVKHPFNTGVQRVSRALARGLEDLGVSLDYVQWDDRLNAFAPLDAAQRRHLAKWNGPADRGPRSISGAHADSWLIVPEILSPPEPTPAAVIRHARARGLNTAFLFHDLIALKHATRFPSSFVEGFLECWRMMREADVILPVSQAAGQDLVAFYAAEADQPHAPRDGLIDACPLAGEFLAAPRSRDVRERGEHDVAVLCVGTIDPRKNQLRLVEALRRLRQQGQADDISLTIVGSTRSFPELAAELALRVAEVANVTLLDHVDDTTLQRLYASCDFTVFASSEEGFGLPILESLWNARPCLCHNAGAIAEVAAGGGCLTVDMRDTDALAAGVLRLARERELYRRLASEAVRRPIKTWSEYAGEVARILARRMGRPTQGVRRLPAFRPPTLLARIPHPATICAGLRLRAQRLRILGKG